MRCRRPDCAHFLLRMLGPFRKQLHHIFRRNPAILKCDDALVPSHNFKVCSLPALIRYLKASGHSVVQSIFQQAQDREEDS